MKRSIIVIGVLVAAVVGAGAYYVNRSSNAQASAADAAGHRGTQGRGGQGGNQGGGNFGGGNFGGQGGNQGGGGRQPMSVEMAAVKRADMSTQIEVVGNLIGAATIEAVPKVAGRLESVNVRLGD